jgi:hypothetical protein
VASVRKGEGASTADTLTPPAGAAGSAGELVFMVARLDAKVEVRLDEMRKALSTIADHVGRVDKRAESAVDLANEAKRTADESNHLRERTDEATRRRFDEGMNAIRSEVRFLQENDAAQNRAIKEGTDATNAQTPMIELLVKESGERKALSEARLQIESEAVAARVKWKKRLDLILAVGGVLAIAGNVVAWLVLHVSPHGTP